MAQKKTSVAYEEKTIGEERRLCHGDTAMKCSECGSDIPEDSVYCFHCGAKTGREGVVASFGGQIWKWKFRRKSDKEKD